MYRRYGGTAGVTQASISTERVAQSPFSQEPSLAELGAAFVGVANDALVDRPCPVRISGEEPGELPALRRGRSDSLAECLRGYGHPTPIGCGLMVAEPRAKRRRYRLRRERRVPAMVVERIEQDAQYQRLLAVVLERTSALERLLGPEQLGAWLRLEDALFEWVHLLQHRYFHEGTRVRGWRRPTRRSRHSTGEVGRSRP